MILNLPKPEIRNETDRNYLSGPLNRIFVFYIFQKKIAAIFHRFEKTTEEPDQSEWAVSKIYQKELFLLKWITM